MRKVWMITGCSTGIGRSLAQELLYRNQGVVATARWLDSIENLKSEGNQELLTAKLDVTQTSDIQRAVKLAAERFGRIDVVVNNVGYGYYSTQEEADLDEVQQIFDTNVFGLARVTQAVLPLMRKQGHGTVVNMSSIGGRVALPCRGFYHASKFAVEGLSEALYYEVCEFGIRVIVVELGAHETEFSRSAVRSPHLTNPQSPYAALIKRWEASARKIVPRKGDPMEVVRAIIEAVERDVPFQRIQVGEDAKDLVTLRETSASDQDFIRRMHDIYGLGLG